jgi:tetratricopeptide (TPR) repeat protein
MSQSGFIMTEADYNNTIIANKHHWYKKLAEDYLKSVPIFIGTSLNESILSLELERLKSIYSDGLGRAFLITRSSLSPIETASLRSRRIIHIQGTLAQFVDWLQSQLPSPPSPRDIVLASNNLIGVGEISSISRRDLEIASSIFPIKAPDIYGAVARLLPNDLQARGRNFLMGLPADWNTVASKIPVWLTKTSDLFKILCEVFDNRERLFVCVGQAGSGKTTAVMQCILRLLEEREDTIAYELRGEIRSVVGALNLLTRIHKEHILLYVGDIFVFGDTFRYDIESIDSGKITIISTARTSEWREHIERHVGEIAITHEYSRFVRDDYQSLIKRLVEYVPAPDFRRASDDKRIAKLDKSRSQLLIALREVTSSRSFSDTIADEFIKLPDVDTKFLFIIIGISTIARVGVDEAFAREVYRGLATSRTFEQAERALDGIVSRGPNGRLVARHELYVRHIIDYLVGIDAFVDSFVQMLRYFSKYQAPVVKSVNRLDAILFKFLLNHDFILEQCRRKNSRDKGLDIYKEFEIAFQLDGHFWLQYGLYRDRCGQHAEAIDLLHKSIEAFPSNSFAIHALAERQLKSALRATHYSAAIAQIVSEALRSLMQLDGNNSLVDDQYPIVTLANLHPSVLLRHGKIEEAKAVARDYFGCIQEFNRPRTNDHLRDLQRKLMMLATTGHWGDESSERPPGARSRGRRRRP